MLRRRLGAHLPLYRKGLTLRHHGYGIGALAYFRRLIEDTTGEMLDLLIEASQEGNAEPALIDKIKTAKDAKSYEDKVKYAVGILPDHLRPGRVDPFGLLHDLLSRGIHGLSDEECVEIVDGMREVLEIIYKELKNHMKEKKLYGEHMKILQQKHAQHKQPKDK